MAACLISVTGTWGVIRINYTIGLTPYTIETSIGSFFIDDTATDVTYTTLSGDLIASDAGCLTPAISPLPADCYEIHWSGITSSGYRANAIILGPTIIPFTETNFPASGFNLVTNINDANNDNVKVVGYKETPNLITSDDPNTSEYSYILKVLGGEVPILRVRNSTNTGYIYLIGEPTSCTIPVGYLPIEPCYTTFPTTTTTTSV